MAGAQKIVVCGGSGFLGSRICKAAAQRGWHVTSISRAGEPTWSTVTTSNDPPSWSKDVVWEKADMLKPSTYNGMLKGADIVVHSMGILLEADYKGVIQGRESPIAGLQRAFSATKRGTQDPLARKEGEDLTPQESDGQLTYEAMNRDSAIALAQEAAAAKVGTFVYISAAGGAPVLPARYIKTKRETEETITTKLPELRGVYMRPGLLYDSSRTMTVAFAWITSASAAFNTVTGGILSSFMGAAGVWPQKVDVVAEATVEAAADESVRGPVEASQMDKLAHTAWRKGML